MAMFAKRHYEALALVLQSTRPEPGYSAAFTTQWLSNREALADMLARDNPQFNRERFKRACEPGANVKARK